MLRRQALTAASLGAAGALLLAACGSGHAASSAISSSTAAGASASPSAAAVGTGPVDVLSAGSLQDLMDKTIVAAFHHATGYTENDFSAGSSTLAADIKDKLKPGDVFVSAAPSADVALEGAANGDWVSWYATFATSRLVLGYNPHSRFAADLKTKPWYDVITEPGFRLGLTPPATDPKGVLAVQALTLTATAQHLPALSAIARDTNDQFPETSLDAEVETGQLDAGFFYLAEANSAEIATVPLTGVDLAAQYTITVLNQAPDPGAADAFVSFLLGPAGQADLAMFGFVATSPATVSGTGVPAALSSVIPTG